MKPFETSLIEPGTIGPRLSTRVMSLVTKGASLLLDRSKAEQLSDASLLPYCEDIGMSMEGRMHVMVGGLAIDAFNHAETEIDADARVMRTSENFDTPLLRSNGTIRDIDVDVIGSATQLETISNETRKTLKEKLVKAVATRSAIADDPTPAISVFGFETKRSLIHTSTLLSENGEISLEQGLTKQVLPKGAMEPWDLVMADGTSVKVLNPWEQLWRSKVRFSSGMKQKDGPKLATMLDKLRDTPGLAEMESSELVEAYKTYHDNMVSSNTFRAVRAEIASPNRDMKRVAQLTLFASASNVMAFGQRFEFVGKFVQATPAIFDHFVGSK